MKKLVIVFYCMVVALIYAQNAVADDRYAHEYYSDSDEERHERHERHDNDRNEWYESEGRGSQFYAPPRYQQPPIQIYLPPNPNFYPKDYSQNYLRHPPNPQTRYDNQWRERRRELERMPQSPYFENQFDRDDTHW